MGTDLMQRSLQVRAVTIAVLAVVAALSIPLPAVAWTFSSNVGSNLFLSRDASDTATATVVIYRYGGVPSAGQWSQSSFDETLPSTAFFYPVRNSPVTVTVDPMCRFISYSAIPSYSHLLAIVETGQKWFVGPGNSQAVYFAYPNSSTASGAVAVSVQGTVAANIASIAAETTMAVSGTLPVSVRSIGGTGSQALDIWLASGLAMAGGVMALAVAGSSFHKAV